MKISEILTEGVAGPKKCWPGHRKVGTQPGTGKNKGKRVNDCEKIKESADQLNIQQLATISDEALDKAYGYGRSSPGNTFGWQANLKSAAYAKQMIDKGVTDIEAISDAIHKGWNVTAKAFVQNPGQFDDTEKLKAAGKLEAKLQQREKLMNIEYGQLPDDEKEKDRVVARALLQALKGQQDPAEDLHQEFDMIESIIELLAAHNGVDAEVIWEDLESLTEDELYAFAVTSEPIMEGAMPASVIKQKESIRLASDEENKKRFKGKTKAELAQMARRHGYKDKNPYAKFHDGITESNQGVAEDWQKANKRDKTDGMSQKAVNAYRRENPGSKLKTAVTTKPSKLKKGSKASKRRKSYCSRSRGQMKMHSISCAKTPDKAICKARRRWNC